jgi:hypothetical protein
VSERNRLIPGAQITVLVAATVAAALSSTAADWHPVALVGVLFALGVASDIMIVEIRGLRVSGAFFSVVLAMVLLGPTPAVAIGLGTTAVYAMISRPLFSKVLNDAAVWAAFALVGGLMSDALMVDATRDAVGYCTVVVLVYMASNILNFLLVAVYSRAVRGFPFQASLPLYVTMFPWRTDICASASALWRWLRSSSACSSTSCGLACRPTTAGRSSPSVRASSPPFRSVFSAP